MFEMQYNDEMEAEVKRLDTERNSADASYGLPGSRLPRRPLV